MARIDGLNILVMSILKSPSIALTMPFGLLDAPAPDGVRACPDPETAVEEVAKTVLKLPGND